MKITFGNQSTANMGASAMRADGQAGPMALYRLDVLVTSLSALLVAGSVLGVALANFSGQNV